MTSTGYHDTGEEWAQKLAWRQDLITRNASFDILLYDDSTNALTDSDDIGAVTTEPSDGNYVRQTVSLDSTDVTLSVVDGDLRAEFTVTFDLTNTTGSVDSWAAVDSFQSDVVNSESGANPHLLTSAGTASMDLSNHKSFDLNGHIDLG